MGEEDIDEYGVEDMYGDIYEVITARVKSAYCVIDGKTRHGEAPPGAQHGRKVGKVPDEGVTGNPDFVVELKGSVNGIGIGEQYENGKAEKR